jgi:diaminopimelate epimerase
MSHFEIIKCHGSGNDFILIDTTALEESQRVDWSAFALEACNRERGIGSDGLLLVVRGEDGCYGMDMINPDGTHAEMCGNGMRAVARYCHERGYIAKEGCLTSGGRYFRVGKVEPVAYDIATYAVDIAITTQSSAFAIKSPGETLVGEVIERLDPTLRFTALNLGNPHIVACVDSIDMSLLESLGHRVLELEDILPEGVNISFYEVLSKNHIFVATYERGAGITLSCGTAMTASATAAAMLGYTESGERTAVTNRGGRVFCTPRTEESGIVTRLEGNATFEWWGEASFADGEFSYFKQRETDEQDVWQRFVSEINKR